MSFAALAWAADQRPGNLAAKMVLLGLANWADENGHAYPSTAALADFGDMDHKTATAALDRLATLKLIEDTGERAGRTRQIKVYRLAIGSPPKTEASQKRKPSAFSRKDPQKRGTDTVREPVSQKTSSSSRARACGTPFPPDFEPKMKGLTASVVDSWPPGRLETEIEAMVDWHAKEGKLSRDWQASWRTWVRNSKRWDRNDEQSRSAGRSTSAPGAHTAAVTSAFDRVDFGGFALPA